MIETKTNFKPTLGLIDATMVVAGSMIGSGIFGNVLGNRKSGVLVGAVSIEGNPTDNLIGGIDAVGQNTIANNGADNPNLGTGGLQLGDLGIEGLPVGSRPWRSRRWARKCTLISFRTYLLHKLSH